MNFPRLHHVSCFFLILFSLLVLPAGLSAQNLVQNGSFSASAASWTFFAPATGTEAYLPETSYGGSVATNIVAEIDAGANLRQANINVTPGITYYLSFRRARRQGGAPPTTGVKVKVYNGASSFLNQDVLSTDLTWTWHCEVLQFTPTTNTVTLDFENTITTGTLGTLLDDVTITPVDQVITINGTACQGATITLNAPSFPADPNANYTNHSWTGPNGYTATGPDITFTNAQPVLNGSYTCTMNLNGCLEVSGVYNLTVLPTLEEITKDICAGETYDFYGTAVFATGTYETLIPGNGNCDRKVVLHLNVKPMPDMTLDNDNNLWFCTGDYVLLQLAQPDAAATYQWLNGITPVSGETGPEYRVSVPGSFRVQGTRDGCSKLSEIIVVNENPLPEARIINENPDLCAMADTALLSAAAGNNFIYRWSPEKPFRAVIGAEGETVQGVFGNSTQVVLTVFSPEGCQATDTTLIVTHPCCEAFVPSAFTPNNDGLNDYFLPALLPGQLMVQLQVYNRYGNLVYELSNNRKGWSGDDRSGQSADAATYMYYMRYTCTDNQVYEKRGDVILLR